MRRVQRAAARRGALRVEGLQAHLLRALRAAYRHRQRPVRPSPHFRFRFRFRFAFGFVRAALLVNLLI